MFTTEKSLGLSQNRPSFAEHMFAYTALLILLGLHFIMALSFEINWDEFFRLGRIYEWKSGTLTAIFESNYVHAFGWLEHVHKNEVYQIIAARCVMFALLIYIAFICFLILTHFFDKITAIITIVSFLSFSFIFRHATSFRIDLPIISLLMTVIWLITCSKGRHHHFFVAGLCLGLAGSISIKSIFYVPTIAAILMVHWGQSGWKLKPFINGLILGLTAIITFAILIYLHSLSLAKAESAYGFISYASNAAIGGGGFFPQKGTFTSSLGQNPIYWALLSFGFMIAGYDVFKGHNRAKALICLSALLPLISLAVYVHTYVYFYTYILAAASLLIGYGLYWVINRSRLAIYIIPLALIASSLPIIRHSLQQTKTYQLQVNNVIHEMFPSPVNYIDRTSQISTFPKQGLFMTVVQMEEYKQKGKPVMKDVFKSKPPEFILANIDSLKLDTVRKERPTRRLMKEDEDLLIDNFIHHWGPIYVPGKRINAEPTAQKIMIELPGTYTIESEGEVNIDGLIYSPQASLHFKKEAVFISSKVPQRIRLRWGPNLYNPDFVPKDNIIFHGF